MPVVLYNLLKYKKMSPKFIIPVNQFLSFKIYWFAMRKKQYRYLPKLYTQLIT